MGIFKSICLGDDILISFIWIEDLNGVIGLKNQLPWELPADQRYFKKTTMGHPIISGSKTYRSYNHPLPGRLNIVLSTSNDRFPEEVVVMKNFGELKKFIDNCPDEEYFVIGGSEVFKQFLPYVDKLYRTIIYGKFNGDTYMPEINYDKFKLISSVDGVIDEKNHFPYKFEVYVNSECD